MIQPDFSPMKRFGILYNSLAANKKSFHSETKILTLSERFRKRIPVPT